MFKEPIASMPTLASLGIAFTAWRLLDTPRFVGLDNFAELARDPLFYKSLGNTATYVFGRVPINLAISLALAVLLNRKVIGRNFVRVVLFLPVVCSNVAVALMWQPLFDPTVGLLNKGLSPARRRPGPLDHLRPVGDAQRDPRGHLEGDRLLHGDLPGRAFRGSRRATTRPRGSTGRTRSRSSGRSPSR